MNRILKFSCECNKGVCVLSRCGVYNDVLSECWNPRDADSIIDKLVTPGFDPRFAYAYCIGCAAPVTWDYEVTIATLNAAYEEGLVQDFLNTRAFDGLAERVFDSVRKSYGGTDAEIHAAIVGALKGTKCTST